MPILDSKQHGRMDNLSTPIKNMDNDVSLPITTLPIESENTDKEHSDLSTVVRKISDKTDSVANVDTDNKHDGNRSGDTNYPDDVQGDDADVNTKEQISNADPQAKQHDDGRNRDTHEDEIPLDGKSTDISDSELGDIDNDKEEIIAALQSLTESNEHIPDGESEHQSDAHLSEVFGPDDGEDAHDELTTPLAELGLATKTLTELNFTWDSTVGTSALGTLDTHCSAQDNQYLRGTNSELEGDTRMSGRRHEDMAFASPVTGVTFDSRMNVYSKPLKDGHAIEEEEVEADDEYCDMDINFPRNASRLALESREAMFRRAMSLLSARCTSVKRDQAENGLPFGIQTPKYIYVTQDKPLPMEPLKAWRGYHGNVYFEPIHINHLKVDEAELLRAKTSVPRSRQTLTAKLTSQQQPRLAIADKENKAESRSESRQTNKSAHSNLSATRQMAMLDRQMVANKLNDNIMEDMIWIEGQENTGSLAVRPKSHLDRRAHDRDLQYNKERIKKGSVVHKLYEEKKSRQRNTKLTVSGGKFTPPTSMSPLLRTQTQYTLSHRLTTNSPDLYHGDAKLPPLDHLRASLKHMNNKPAPIAKGYNRAVTLTADMKPFVKYSPDVVAKFAQQAAL